VPLACGVPCCGARAANAVAPRANIRIPATLITMRNRFMIVLLMSCVVSDLPYDLPIDYTTDMKKVLRANKRVVKMRKLTL
jgi:hypothetical protein